jgi:hypothetical protein
MLKTTKKIIKNGLGGVSRKTLTESFNDFEKFFFILGPLIESF